GRTDDLSEPSKMGGVPGSLAGGADIVSQHEGFAPQLGCLQSPQGLFTRLAQLTHARGCSSSAVMPQILVFSVTCAVLLCPQHCCLAMSFRGGRAIGISENLAW